MTDQCCQQPLRSFPRRSVGVKLMLLALLALSTASFRHPVAAATAPCHSLLPNGGFEKQAGWQVHNSDGLALMSTRAARTGQYGAYLAGRHSVVDRLATVIDLPVTGTTLTLSFWWQLQSQEDTTGYDRLTVRIADANGLPLQTLLTLRGRDATHEWQLHSNSLATWAGQTVQLQFLAYTDAQQMTDFLLDDVELLACGTTPQPAT